MNNGVMKSLLLVLVLFGYFVSFTTPVFATDLDCNWAAINNPGSEYHGRLAYCFGGFDSEAQFKTGEVSFPCQKNCGAWGARGLNFIRRIFGGNSNTQVVPLSGFTPTLDNDKYMSCITGDVDTSVKEVIDDCLRDRFISTGVVTLAVGIPITIATVGSGGLVAAGAIAIGAGGAGLTTAQVMSMITNECSPQIGGVVSLPSGETCSDDLTISFNLTTEESGEIYTPEQLDETTYEICSSNLGTKGEAFKNCSSCMENKGIWTAIGCIDQDPESMISKFITIGMGVVGGFFLLRVLSAAFAFTTSQGDVKKTSEAKEMIIEAIVGVIVIIFSVTLIQFFGSTILKIPGFGS